MELRARTDEDLSSCERLACAVHAADGYPPRFADDLRRFVSAPGAFGAWVATTGGATVGHVALLPRGSSAVTALACEATGRTADEHCVVARLLVSTAHRRKGLGGSLLATAAAEGHARGLWPILDVSTHLVAAVRLYERSGWVCAGQVIVQFPHVQFPHVHFPHVEPLEELVYIGPPPGGGAVTGAPVRSRR